MQHFVTSLLVLLGNFIVVDYAERYIKYRYYNIGRILNTGQILPGDINKQLLFNEYEYI